MDPLICDTPPINLSEVNVEENYEEYSRKPEGNTLGIVGFVLSIICVTAVIGLPLSIIALRRRPRGLAIAGVVLGAIFLLLQIGAVFLVLTFIEDQKWESVSNWIDYNKSNSQIVTAATEYELKNGRYPAKLSDLELGTDVTNDPWGNSYRLSYVKHPFDDSVLPYLQSAGKDGIWDNEDDPTKSGKSQLIDIEEFNEKRTHRSKDVVPEVENEKK